MKAESSSAGAKDELSQEGVPETLRQRICRVLKEENVALRIIPVFLYGAIACTARFLALYLRQLGLDAFRVGLILTIRPILGFFCTPMWGFISDRFKIWRFVFIISIIGTMLFGISVIFIPPAEREPCDIAISNLATNLGVSYNYSTTFNQSAYSRAYLNELEKIMVEKKVFEDKTWLYDERGVMVVFWEFMVAITLYELFFAANLSSLDVAIVRELKGNPKFYSKFRSFGSLGWIVGSLLSGGVLQYFRKVFTICGIDFTLTDYRCAFILMACFYVAALPIACTLKYDNIQNDKEYDVKNFVMILIKPENVSVYALAVFVGIVNSFGSYFYWHLENIGASQLLMGTATALRASAEMIWGLFFQSAVLERLGHINLLTLGLLLYAVRFFILGILTNPILILPIECVMGASYFAVWTTLVSYTVHSFPPQFTATCIAFLCSLFHNLGPGIGTVLTGFLIEKYNSTTTCIVYCVSLCCFLVLFRLARWNFTDVQPEKESMNLITDEEHEKDKMRESTQLNGTPTTQVQTPLPTVPKSYNSITKKGSS
ncbi:major facilitator superfamily domain-containing protein 6-like [Antedon mediterranea]|uniref:major facilitator superfamily domain-containing protein 6-like n=1 Tax=Antedon mediterranea TaxID=105859 RepID=UPI003AF5D605